MHPRASGSTCLNVYTSARDVYDLLLVCSGLRGRRTAGLAPMLGWRPRLRAHDTHSHLQHAFHRFATVHIAFELPGLSQAAMPRQSSIVELCQHAPHRSRRRREAHSPEVLRPWLQVVKACRLDRPLCPALIGGQLGL